eukprot:1160088-Pelagomonas_calceolata.AAC.23
MHHPSFFKHAHPSSLRDCKSCTHAFGVTEHAGGQGCSPMLVHVHVRLRTNRVFIILCDRGALKHAGVPILCNHDVLEHAGASVLCNPGALKHPGITAGCALVWLAHAQARWRTCRLSADVTCYVQIWLARLHKHAGASAG